MKFKFLLFIYRKKDNDNPNMFKIDWFFKRLKTTRFKQKSH